MKWGAQQSSALSLAHAWLKDRKAPQVFRLFGFAGSGKTTLAKHLAEGVPNVLYACFTGKAALVLRKKGCDGATTIHSLIYKPRQDERTGKVEFRLNRDSPAATADLIVIDEVSMVGEDLARDLLSYDTKVLVLGDPAQLPPVKGEGFFINGEPDVMLTEVHRQAAENPIIRMSMDVREGRGLAPGQYGDSRVLRRADIEREAMAELVIGSDQLLCGLNKTRQGFNARMRQLKGLNGDGAIWLPTVGDRLVCLKNNRDKNIFNGGLWGVTRVTADSVNVNIRVESQDEEGRSPVDVCVHPAFFQGKEKELDWRMKRNYDEFTYGWALTCHKSQGSQWDGVMVFDEGYCFREDAAKWMYTAVTRAAERVTVVI